MTEIVAVVCIVLGAVLRIVAIRTLGRNFVLSLGWPHSLVVHGVYRYVRHPSYTGSLLVLSGVAILCPVIAIIWLAFAFFLSRAVAEEQILKSYPGYADYAARTGMFIPKVRQ